MRTSERLFASFLTHQKGSARAAWARGEDIEEVKTIWNDLTVSEINNHLSFYPRLGHAGKARIRADPGLVSPCGVKTKGEDRGKEIEAVADNQSPGNRRTLFLSAFSFVSSQRKRALCVKPEERKSCLAWRKTRLSDRSISYSFNCSLIYMQGIFTKAHTK